MNMDIIFYVGFFLVCTGGASLDSNGTGYIIALTLCAAGLYTLFDALDKADWNETEIETRAKWLFEHAKDAWQI